MSFDHFEHQPIALCRVVVVALDEEALVPVRVGPRFGKERGKRIDERFAVGCAEISPQRDLTAGPILERELDRPGIDDDRQRDSLLLEQVGQGLHVLHRAHDALRASERRVIGLVFVRRKKPGARGFRREAALLHAPVPLLQLELDVHPDAVGHDEMPYQPRPPSPLRVAEGNDLARLLACAVGPTAYRIQELAFPGRAELPVARIVVLAKIVRRLVVHVRHVGEHHQLVEAQPALK